MNESFYVGALGAGSCTEKFSVIANNLANINNNGFKPKTVAFSNLINYSLNGAGEQTRAGAGMKTHRTYTSFDSNGITQTNSEYDYAIMEPNAFFMVQDPQTNEIAYTRNGQFYRAEREDGYYLMTYSGKLVLDQNQEPILLKVPDIEKIQGEMEEGYEPEEETNEYEDNPEDRPRVSLYTFENPSRLMNVGDHEYVPADEGAEPILVKNPNLTVNALERSGTDMAKELARMMECQRAFTYALRMVTTSDEIEGTINTLRG